MSGEVIMLRRIKDNEEQKQINQSFNQKFENEKGSGDAATNGGSGDDFNIKKIF
jgi:hypothetical protein